MTGLLWMRPHNAEMQFSPDERRVRDFIDAPHGVSESVDSLANKLGINRRYIRRVLEQLAQEGVVRRLDFAGIQPLYCRFPNR